MNNDSKYACRTTIATALYTPTTNAIESKCSTEQHVVFATKRDTTSSRLHRTRFQLLLLTRQVQLPHHLTAKAVEISLSRTSSLSGFATDVSHSSTTTHFADVSRTLLH